MRARRVSSNRRGAIGNRGQNFVIDFNARGRVFRDVARVRDDHRNRLAGQPRLIAWQGIVRGIERRGTIGVDQRDFRGMP